MLHGGGDAGHVPPHLLRGVRASGLDRRNSLTQRLGDPHHLAAHPVNGLGGAALALFDVAGQFAKRRLHAVELAVGGGVEPLGEFGPIGLGLFSQLRRQALEPPLGRILIVYGLGRGDPSIETRERGLEFLNRTGGAAFGLDQPVANPGDHGFDQGARGFRFEPRFDPVETACGVIHVLADFVEHGARAAFGFVNLLGHLAERGFERAHGFESRRILVGQPAEPLADLGLDRLDLFEFAIDPCGHGVAVPLHALHTRQHTHDLLIDAGDRQRRAMFRRLQPMGQGV